MPMTMMANSAAADTNVLIYLHDKFDTRKRRIAENVLADAPKISSQVISEYINVTRKLLDLPKPAILTQCAALLENCEIIPVYRTTLIAAAKLMEKHGFQIFDSIIVAAAMEANCSVLYSEDMQHGFTINNMTIINPFL